MVIRVLVVQHEDDCPPAWIGEWLVEAGCTLDVRRPYAGDDLPAELGEHDALLVLGGAMGANDDAAHAWLAPTRELVRKAVRRALPTLGICLGQQLVAVALGRGGGPEPRWSAARVAAPRVDHRCSPGRPDQWAGPHRLRGALERRRRAAHAGRDCGARPLARGRAAGVAFRTDGLGRAAASGS